MALLDLELSVNAKGRTVYVKGTLDSSTVTRFESVVARLAQEKAGHITLDLRGADYVSSAGWSSLVRLRAQAKEVGGEMVLTNLEAANRILADHLKAGGHLAIA